MHQFRGVGAKVNLYQWAYIFGAACPDRGVGAGLVLPFADTEAMPWWCSTAPAGTAARKWWCRQTLTLLKLPPYAPANSTENIWEYMRKYKLANRTYADYRAIVDACCRAWNDFVADPELVTSVTKRAWASVS